MVERRKQIGIIGGGASGALAAIHCRLKAGESVEITIFEPAQDLGRGKAYSPESTDYLLNVPAERMSAYPDRPTDFADWLRERLPASGSGAHWPFVARTHFGAYLKEQVSRARATHIRVPVAAIYPDADGYRLRLRDSSERSFSHLVVATGYQPSLLSPNLAPLGDRALQPAEAEAARVRGEVLVIGSGLTAVDLWRLLRARADTRVTLLSRRGLLPHPHGKHDPIPAFPDLSGLSPRAVLTALRSLEGPWPAIADQVRARGPELWRAWSPRARRRFLTHLKLYWEVIRHRVPASVHAELEAGLESGRLRVLAGRIVASRLERGKPQLVVRARASALETSIEADWVVLATGSSISQEFDRVPGLRPCPHGFGYVNESAPRLWTIGPASKSESWEITAVPDIREQAARIAAEIAREL